MTLSEILALACEGCEKHLARYYLRLGEDILSEGPDQPLL